MEVVPRRVVKKVVLDCQTGGITGAIVGPQINVVLPAAYAIVVVNRISLDQRAVMPRDDPDPPIIVPDLAIANDVSIYGTGGV
jgi:hypothetical protein